MGIASRVAIVFSLLVLLATATVGYLVYRGARISLISASTDRLVHTADVVEVRFSASIEAVGKDLRFLAETPPVQGLVRVRQASRRGFFLDPETAISDQEWRGQLQDLFQVFLENRPSYLSVSYYDYAGGEEELVRVEKQADRFYRVPLGELKRGSGEPFLRETRSVEQGNFYLSEIGLTEWRGQYLGRPVPTVTAATPVFRDDGVVVGLAAIEVDLRAILRPLQALASPDKLLYLADEGGQFLLHPDSLRTFGYAVDRRYLIQEEFPMVRPLMRNERSFVRIEQTNTETTGPVSAYFERIEFDRGAGRNTMLLGITSPHDEVLAGVKSVRNRSLLITFLFALSGMLIALGLSGYVTRPISRITHALTRLGKGSVDVELPVERSDEIGVLARTYQTMARQIEEQVQELENKERRYRTILETSAEGIIVTDADGHVEIFNPAAERILGYPAEEVIGRSVASLIVLCEHACDGQEHPGSWITLPSGAETKGLRADGGQVPLAVAWSTFWLAEQTRYTLILQDITERRASEETRERLVEELSREREALQQLSESLEERVRLRTSDLERANIVLGQRNRELQDFAYVASHDLQEPLRKIRAFADLLQLEGADQLGENLRFYLDRIGDSARRMSDLITDLLSFSRVSTQEERREPVALDRVVREVLSDLDMRLKEEDGVVEVGELPTINADPGQMRQLFQNLVVNALKFHRPGVPPVIRIRASVEWSTDLPGDSQEVCRIEIEDNGIGFDEKYLDRIFSPFQRLHRRDDYEGTGMGLTICRRIAERHGGTITAFSRPGEGSTFVVLLPVSPLVPSEAPA